MEIPRVLMLASVAWAWLLKHSAAMYEEVGKGGCAAPVIFHSHLGTESDCETACEQRDSCTGFSYPRPNWWQPTPADQSNCFLHSTNASEYTVSGCVGPLGSNCWAKTESAYRRRRYYFHGCPAGVSDEAYDHVGYDRCPGGIMQIGDGPIYTPTKPHECARQCNLLPWCTAVTHVQAVGMFYTSRCLFHSDSMHDASGLSVQCGLDHNWDCQCWTKTATATTTTTAGPILGINQSIISGDIVFLKTRAGKGNHVDVEGVAVQARWQSQGNWQAMTIEKEKGGSIHAGNVVFLRAHTGRHLDVTEHQVQARWDDRGDWQAFVIEKKIGWGAILADDLVCLKSRHTGTHLDVEDHIVRARWDDCRDWQTMTIQKETAGSITGAITSGDPIFLVADIGLVMEVSESGTTSAEAVWVQTSDRGMKQRFEIHNFGGRAISSGDEVFLIAHTGKMLDVESTRMQARWNDWGAWQKFVVVKADGDGPIFPGDNIFLLSAHTGNWIQIRRTSGHGGGYLVATSTANDARQSFSIEKSFWRRLSNIATETSPNVSHTTQPYALMF